MKKIALFSLVCCLGMTVNNCMADDEFDRKLCGGNVCKTVDDGNTVEQDACKGKKVGDKCKVADATEAYCKDNRNNGKNYLSCTAMDCNGSSYLWLTNKRQEIEVTEEIPPLGENDEYRYVGKGKTVASQGVCRTESWLKEKCDCGTCGRYQQCQPNYAVVRNIDSVVKFNGKVVGFVGAQACSCQYHCRDFSGDDAKACDCEELHHDNQDRLKCCLEGKEWDKENNRCYDDEMECRYTFTGTITCENGRKLNLSETGKTVTVPCDLFDGAQGQISWESAEAKINGLSKDKEEYMKKLKKIAQDLCDEKPEPKKTVAPTSNAPKPSGPSKSEINNAQSTLKGFFDSAKSNASVWRTSEGNFNGARLASDITAGVVLGTVGGVVSGVVIKKNQVKKGFEALHCTVGGQKVAEWGDEFSVGLRR